MAAGQYGVITRAQAISAGLSASGLDRRISSRRFRVIHPGVYRIAGTPPSWEQALVAACLWADGTASHRAAALLWRLDGAEREIVEITTARRVRAADVTIHTSRLDPRDLTSVGRIPVTTVTRTLLDLGSVAKPTAVEAALTDALRRRLTTQDRLRRCLERAGGKGRRGAKVLRSILATVGTRRPESVLELRLIRLLRRAGLPEPVSQFNIRKDGAVLARVDLAYPGIRLAIEADGYRYHAGPGAWKRDLARRNAVTSLGWRVIHVTWEDVSTRPDEVVRQLRAAMGSPTR
jgi:very-short-patch-repair endonuclease